MDLGEIWHWVLVSLLSILLLSGSAEAVGCFVCTSYNHDNRECEDTFNNTDRFYKSDCWASRTGRSGHFPATQCIKMIATDEAIGFSLVVRDCVVDDGGTNSETEIGRQSHCGWMKVIKFNGKRMRGCILACERDGCNHGDKHKSMKLSFLLAISGFVYVLTTKLLTNLYR